MTLNKGNNKKGRPSMNLRNYYKEYTNEELDSAFLLLPVKDQLLLQKIYGKDLSSIDFSDINPQEKSRMYYVRKKLSKILNGSTSKEELRKRQNQSERALSLKAYFYGYDWNIVKKAFEYLPQKAKELLIEAYGENLDEVSGFMQMPNNMRQKVRRARLKMKELVGKIENNEPIEIKKQKKENEEQSLLDYLKEFSPEKIQQGIEYMSPNSQLFLKKAYGDDFSSINIDHLSLEERTRLIRLKRKLKHRIKTNYRPKRKDIRYHSLYDFFKAYSKEEIDKIVLSLDLESLKLLRKTFGNTLVEGNHYSELSQDERQKLTGIRTIIKRKLQESKQKQKKAQQTTIKKKENNTAKEDTRNKRKVKNSSSNKPLSRIQEIRFIKKVKLSYYEDVDKELQKKYLKYFFEVYPAKGEKYKKIIQETIKIIRELEEEKDYERCVEKKKILKQLRKKQQKLLKEYIEESKKHRDKFLLKNEGLIISMANSFNNPDLVDELISEGQFGLMRALEKFDLEKGNKFSTYATRWIFQSINKFLKSKEKTIRLPDYKETEISKMNNAIERLTIEFARNPEIEEIAQETGFTIEKIEELLKNKYQFSSITNLSQTVFDDSDLDLESTIGTIDEQFQKVEEQIAFDELLALLKRSYLTDQEIMVIEEIYGLDHTEKEVSIKTGLSEIRVAIIEQSALKKMRSNPNIYTYLKKNR